MLLLFQKARYEIIMDTEMDHYIPEYREKWLEIKENGKISIRIASFNHRSL